HGVVWAVAGQGLAVRTHGQVRGEPFVAAETVLLASGGRIPDDEVRIVVGQAAGNQPAPVRAVCQGLVPLQDEGAGPESGQGLARGSGERHGPVTCESTQFLVTESPLIIPLPAEQVWLIRGPASPVVALPLIVQHSDNLVDLALFPVVVRHWTHLGN